MKKQPRKLSLARETLRRLETSSLQKAFAAGIFPGNTDEDSCCVCFSDECLSYTSTFPVC